MVPSRPGVADTERRRTKYLAAAAPSGCVSRIAIGAATAPAVPTPAPVPVPNGIALVVIGNARAISAASPAMTDPIARIVVSAGFRLSGQRYSSDCPDHGTPDYAS